MYMWENLDVLVEIPDVHVLILRQLPVFAASITIPLFSHASFRRMMPLLSSRFHSCA